MAWETAKPLRNHGALIQVIEQQLPNAGFAKKRIVANKVYRFIQLLKDSVKRTRHIEKFEARKKSFIGMNASKVPNQLILKGL
jgi:hypothetical protein